MDFFKKRYLVGAITPGSDTQEIGNHCYSVLGAYEVQLENGSKVKLVRYFNPHHSEAWDSNPWADNSSQWTDFVKNQVPYMKGDDGIVFSTVEDYLVNFRITVWAEIYDDYESTFIDVPFKGGDDMILDYPYEINFTYYGDPGQDLYIFNDQSNSRLLMECGALVEISDFCVFYQDGTKYCAPKSTVKIPNAPQGSYIARFTLKKNQNLTKYFTINSYSQAGKLTFIPLENSLIADYKKKKCPNSCNLQGSCNTVDGTCKCYFGVKIFIFYCFLIMKNKYEGEDCGQIIKKACLDCPVNGVCDEIFGIFKYLIVHQLILIAY